MNAITTPTTTPTLTAERVIQIERLYKAAARFAWQAERHLKHCRQAKAERCWRWQDRMDRRAMALLVEAMPQEELRRLVDLKLAALMHEMAR